jgi:transglutaminase-like putative cysteine protease
MRLAIRHVTAHRYDTSPAWSAQLLRLTPRTSAGQRVERWQLQDAGGARLVAFRDAYGNACHYLRRPAGAREARIVAEGEVETLARSASGGEREPLPPPFFLRATPLTARSEAVEALAREARRIAREPEKEPLALAALVRERLAHRSAVTHVATPAAEALVAAAGVCQDRAHVFLAAARALGHPARYVSGYVLGGAPDEAGAMHAWIEWWGARGWLALDPSTGAPCGESHVQVAIGLDYAGAAPLRGVRGGGAGERLAVAAQVQLAQ